MAAQWWQNKRPLGAKGMPTMKKLLSLLILLTILLSATACAKEINYPDLAAYAGCVNGLGVEYGVPTILWDCSVHIDRKTLNLNSPGYVEAIMAQYPAGRTPGNGGDDALFEPEDPFRAASNMGPGFNLGNTLDSTSYNLNDAKAGKIGWILQWGQKGADGKVLPKAFETAWGQPQVTAAQADYILSLGFGTVRVPVTWAEHLDENGTIDPAWMDRVEEVVSLFHSRGAYVILNVHHDGGADGWAEASEASYNAYSARFAGIWQQIARRFERYDERLMFEGINEMLDEHNNWNTPSPEAAKWHNAWNSLFVKTVRATGGNNAQRNLLLMTYSGGGSETNFTSLTLPEGDEHLMITVHNYDPQAFTWTTATWTTMTARWDAAVHGEMLRKSFEVYKKYSDLYGVPVVLGEYNADPKAYEDYE
ncbi:MAG: glycoside hydrolase family 5 protein [Clostridiales bacterium]|nr:glycoside hydrolase family 5 protein [Clostridiales bacterium]